MTYKEVIDKEAFRESFGDQSGKYIRAYSAMIENAEVADEKISTKSFLKGKTPSEKKELQRLAKISASQCA